MQNDIKAVVNSITNAWSIKTSDIEFRSGKDKTAFENRICDLFPNYYIERYSGTKNVLIVYKDETGNKFVIVRMYQVNFEVFTQKGEMLCSTPNVNLITSFVKGYFS